MLITLTLAAALGGPVRHLIEVDVPVAIPTTAWAVVPEVPEEPIASELEGVRVTRWVPQTGEVPLDCGTQDEEGAFVEAHQGHRSRLFLRDGTAWLEYQPAAWPESIEDWPAFECVWEEGGRRILWNVHWVEREAPPPETTTDEE